MKHDIYRRNRERKSTDQQYKSNLERGNSLQERREKRNEEAGPELVEFKLIIVLF